MTQRLRVGLIGAGLMGHGVGKNIVEKGFPLTVLAHRNRVPIDDLVGRGAREGRSPSEMAQGCDLVITCVTGSPQVEEVVFGGEGLLAGMRPGLIIADASTADPESTAKIAAAVAAAGGRFVDIPLTRTPNEAEAGTLGIMCAGDPATIEAIRPVLDCFADTIVHCGAVGSAHKAKLINNMLSLGTAAVVAEALAVATKAGVDLRALHKVVSAGGANSVMFQRLAAWVLDGDDTQAKFALANAQKDLRYYARMAESLPATAYIAGAIHQTFVLANTLGYGQEYVPHLVDALIEANGGKTPSR
jgi:3-hydroxyisobutyrate dehydrogenase-like beta-hydroxyacid dehydrogenase